MFIECVFFFSNELKDLTGIITLNTEVLTKCRALFSIITSVLELFHGRLLDYKIMISFPKLFIYTFFFNAQVRKRRKHINQIIDKDLSDVFALTSDNSKPI